MKPTGTFVAAFALGAVLAVEAAAQPPPPAQQDIRRIDVTRWVLSHGRVDDVRSKGIRTPEDPRGQQVNGLSTAFRQGQVPPPGATRTVLDVVGLLRDPYRVTLDLDKDGRRPRNPQQPHPLVVAGAIIPSGFTLVVAELANPLDRGVITRW